MMDALNKYIEECNQNKKDIENEFEKFINMLNDIKANPTRIFTNFFNDISITFFYNIHFSSDVLQNILLPLIKNIQLFYNMSLQSEGTTLFGIFDNYTPLMDIDLKEKTFRNYCKKPKWKDYKYTHSESIEKLYNIACALENFYKNKTLKNLRKVIRLDNPKKKIKIFMLELIYLNRTENNKKNIKRIKDDFESEKECEVDAEKQFAEKMRIWNKNKDKIEKIKKYLVKLEYQELSD